MLGPATFLGRATRLKTAATHGGCATLSTYFLRVAQHTNVYFIFSPASLCVASGKSVCTRRACVEGTQLYNVETFYVSHEVPYCREL